MQFRDPKARGCGKLSEAKLLLRVSKEHRDHWTRPLTDLEYISSLVTVTIATSAGSKKKGLVN